MQRCAELLSRATKPLVLVGSQAMLPPTPAEELRWVWGRRGRFGVRAALLGTEWGGMGITEVGGSSGLGTDEVVWGQLDAFGSGSFSLGMDGVVLGGTEGMIWGRPIWGEVELVLGQNRPLWR